MNKIIYFIILGLLTSSCGPNALSGLGSESSDEYYLEEAMKANNAQDYDTALDILLNQLSVGGQTRTDAKELLAGAYAGKCGFNFIDYTTKLSDTTSGSAFMISMLPFVGVSTTPSYCLLSLQTMDSIGAPAQRTAGQNTFTAITGLVMLGASLRTYADQAPAGGNGVADVELCSGVTNAQMDDVIVGYGYFAENLAYVSAALIGGSSLGSLTDAASKCSELGISCTITDKADITANIRNAFRDLNKTVEYGIGSCVTNGDALAIAACCQ